MRKSYIALAVLSLAALAGCQQNEFYADSLEKGEIGFSLTGSKTTKADTQVASIKGATIDLGVNESGNHFFLEETITNLDVIAPETKGTPAYTENVRKLYNDKFSAAVYNSEGEYESNGEFVYDSSRLKYVRKYGNDLWSKPPLTFYLWMPSELNDAVGVSDLSFSEGKISFSYDGTQLTEAADMQDILFTSRTFSGVGTGEGEYDEKNGAEVLFHHALTGVKFAIGNATKDNVAITKVEFSGLVDGGDCVITPIPEKGKYVDDPETYSSSTNGVVVWNNPSRSSTTYSSGTFSTTLVNFSKSTTGEDGTTISGSFKNNGDYPDSFATAGNQNNLNDEDATQTFWFIPQTLTADVQLTITYTINNVEQDPWTIEFGASQLEHNVVWKAGELRTYTIKIDDVNVKIRDVVTMNNASQQPLVDEHGDPIFNPKTGQQYTATSYNGSTKTGVTITNTGNTDVYIRAAIVGQWLDVKEVDEDGNPTIFGDPVFGYTDYTNGLQHVDSWYQDQFINPIHVQGKFEGLVGYDGASSSYWVLENDGYYYYKYVVPADKGTIPGAYKTVTNGQATEMSAPEALDDQRLFTKYTVGKTPSVVVSGEVRAVYFRLEIATQAISAKKIDGSYYDTYTDAWDNAFNQDNE